MFCLYTLPLARPAQAKIQMLTTSSRIVTILLKALLKSLGLYKKLSLYIQIYIWDWDLYLGRKEFRDLAIVCP